MTFRTSAQEAVTHRRPAAAPLTWQAMGAVGSLAGLFIWVLYLLGA